MSAAGLGIPGFLLSGIGLVPGVVAQCDCRRMEQKIAMPQVVPISQQAELGSFLASIGFLMMQKEQMRGGC